MVSDFTVTGFDGTELASHVHPVLTTITTNPFGWGQAAAQTLLQAVDRASKESIAEVNLAPGLLEVRSSTARPPKAARRAQAAAAANPCRARLEPPT
jgi:DNA-binding LacI/PurR family transcriptional regulator